MGRIKLQVTSYKLQAVKCKSKIKAESLSLARFARAAEVTEKSKNIFPPNPEKARILKDFQPVWIHHPFRRK